MVLIQNLYGLPSIRRTADEVSMNMAYRWFLGYGLNETTPHFSTISYNFRNRFTTETIDKIFNWISDEIAEAEYLKPEVVFIDGTHIKANDNTKKQVKEEIPVAAKRYADGLMREINLDRGNHDKNRLTIMHLRKAEAKEKITHQKRNWQITKKRLRENGNKMFKFSTDVRKAMYATNAIESLNSALRRLNSQRSVFPSDTALLKALYLATFEATKKWTMPLRNWGKVYGELSIMYDGRLF